MATKSVTVKESAYEALKSRKREGESFSDVIERIAGRKPITDLVEAVSDKEGERIADELEKVHNEFEEEIETSSRNVEEAVE